MPDSLDWIANSLAKLDEGHHLRRLRQRAGGQSAEVVLENRRLVNFGANDYLGLASDPRIQESVIKSMNRNGWGSGASPLVSGRSTLQAELERRLAALEQSEAALVFPTGFAANVGAICGVVEKGDAIFSDAKNHASIIDGCRLSGATVHVFAHNDPQQLGELLRQRSSDFRRRLIVTDGLFSMDGDTANLSQLIELAKEFDAMLMVDEAHATGVFGQNGAGVAEHQQMKSHVDICVGTLSKACASLGGFVAGSRNLIDWLANRARTFVFSTALPAAVCAGSLAALNIIRDEPFRRQELLASAERLRHRLQEQGWNLGNSSSQIIPVYLGCPQRTMEVSNRLFDRGLFVPGIRPPSVPVGESLLRISLSYGHSDAMIDRLIEELSNVR